MSKESGLSGVVRKTLKLAGVLVPPAAGIALASTASPTMGVTAAIAAKAATEGTKYLLNAAASFDAGWKPQMFGNWLKKRIDRIMKEQSC